MKEELFDVVDEDDKVIGQSSRVQCHENNLIHRSVMFFVFDPKKRVLVTKRTRDKDFFPGYFSIALGGHVLSGESYEDAAVREIEEEIGILAKSYLISEFKKRIPEERENVKVFGVIVKDDIKLNDDEIERGEFVEFNDLEEKMNEEDFLPETEILYSILFSHLS